MKLEDLGYNQKLETQRKEQGLDGFEIARITAEHKDRYEVRTIADELEAELIGNLRFNAESREDLPVVGDWVAITEYDDSKALIHAVLPRHSTLERQQVGKSGQKQIIASNIDFGIIVQSVNRDFSLNRLERYITICNASHVAPIIILSKIDLVDETVMNDLLQQVNLRVKAPIIALSSISNRGYEELKSLIEQGKTYCLLGSSGVGKSTLLNQLVGSQRMATGDISESIERGKHITTHRELIVLKSGGIIIDNPGMREIGITEVEGALELTFDEIMEIAEDCRFNDCSHTNEKGCAILKALEEGELDEEAYMNFQKMQREKSHFESTIVEKRRKDKDLGKLIRQAQKNKRDSKK